MVTCSRITVSSPMRTPTGIPSRYLKSWGTPPMTLPWPTRQRAPMLTRPSRTTCAPTSVPSPILTSGPITEYGATLTPAPSSARGSMMAVGWIIAGTRSFVLLLHRGLLRLVVVGAEHVVGQIRLRGRVENGGPLALEHHGEPLLLADFLDEPAHVLQDLRQ